MTTPPSSSPVESHLLSRLDHLEHRLRTEGRKRKRLERLVVCGGILAIGLGTLAARGLEPVSDVVQTRRLEILDGNNRVVVLATAAQHGGRIDLWDAAEKNAARLGCNGVGGDLSLFNRDGRQVLAAYADGTAGRVEVNGPSGIPGVLLAADESGGLLTTADEKGMPVTKLASGSGHGRLEINGPNGGVCRIESVDGAGRLAVTDPTDERRTTLDAGDGLQMEIGRTSMVRLGVRDSDTILELNADADGERRLHLHATPTGGLVKAMNASAQETVVFGTSANGSGFRVYNDDSTGVVAIGADAEGRGAIEIANETGVRSCSLAATSTGGGLALAGPSGKNFVELDVLANGGRLDMMDRRDDLIASLRAVEGGAEFKLGIDDAGVGVSMIASREQSASLGIFGPGGRTVSITANPTGGRVRLFDADGKPTISAGAASTGPGGVFSLRNGTGIQAVKIGTTGDGEGQLELFNPSGTRKRTITSP